MTQLTPTRPVVGTIDTPAFSFGLTAGWEPAPADVMAEVARVTGMPTAAMAYGPVDDGFRCELQVQLGADVDKSDIKLIRSGNAARAVQQLMMSRGQATLLGQPFTVLLGGETAGGGSMRMWAASANRWLTVTDLLVEHGHDCYSISLATADGATPLHWDEYLTTLATWTWR